MSPDLQEQVFGSVGKWQEETTFVVLLERREQAGWWRLKFFSRQNWMRGFHRVTLKAPSESRCLLQYRSDSLYTPSLKVQLQRIHLTSTTTYPSQLNYGAFINLVTNPKGSLF